MFRRAALPVALLAAAGLALAIPGRGPSGAALAAQPGIAAPSLGDNAALQYWRTWHLQPKDFHLRVAEAYNAADKSWTPDADLTAALLENQTIVRGLIKAAAMPACDWGIRREEGFLALLPHLSLLRQSARLLGADARRCLTVGDDAGAFQRVEALFHLAHHAGGDGFLISDLVEIAILHLGATQIEHLIATGRITPEQRAGLAAWLRATYAHDDAFGLKASILSEGVHAANWCATFTGPSAGKGFQDMLISTDAVSPASRDVRIDALDGPFLAKAAQQLNQYYQQCVAVWDEPDAAERLDALGKSAAAGDAGPLGPVLAPALGNAHRSDMKARAMLESLLRTLDTGVVPEKAAEAK